MELVSEPVMTLSGRGKKAGRWAPAPSDFERTWNGVATALDRAVVGLRKEVVDLIVNAGLAGLEDTTRDAEAPIPTGLLIVDAASGAADRSRAFEQMVDQLRSRSGCPRVVTLRSTAHSTLAAALKEVIGERSVENRLVDRVIVCIEDADKFPPGIVRDLIYSLAVARERTLRIGRTARADDTTLPLGILSCICGSSDAFFSLLGVRETSLIDVSEAKLPDASAAVDTVFREVLQPRRIGPEFTHAVYRTIMEEFYEREMTLAALVRALQMAYMLLYTTRSERSDVMSIACSGPSGVQTLKTWLDAVRQSLLKSHLDIILELKSVQIALRGRNSDPSYKELKDMISAWSLDLFQRRAILPTLERCVASVWNDASVPGPAHTAMNVPMLRKVFEAGMEKCLASHPLLESAIRKLKDRNAKSLRQLLASWSDHLQELRSKKHVGRWRSLSAVLEAIQSARDALEGEAQLTSPPSARKNPADEEPSAAGSAELVSRKLRMAGGTAARLQRRRQLTQFIEKQASEEDNHISNELKRAREQATKALNGMASMIFPVETLPLHELHAVSGASALRRALGSDVAQPRGAILHALKSPQQFNIAHDDACEAYEILSHTGRSVGAREWLSSFAAIVETQAGVPAEAVNGRFARACADLEYLGFVRAMPRAPGRVQRLLFERS